MNSVTSDYIIGGSGGFGKGFKRTLLTAKTKHNTAPHATYFAMGISFPFKSIVFTFKPQLYFTIQLFKNILQHSFANNDSFP